MRFGFTAPSLSSDQLANLSEVRNRAAADCIRLVSLASSGHPGGSLSTLDALVVLYACGELDGSAPHAPNRDRVIVSHGHVSPAVYSTLAAFDFINMEDAYNGFRRAGSIFGGHIESVVPGVEWNTGNLGQGLSAGAGFAMSARLHGRDTHVFVGMGDGEQQKGQIAEARRFAAKFGLGNLTAFIDVNRLQIGGKTDDIMPMDLAAQWAADGWDVVTLDGHDHQALYGAFRAARSSEKPTVLLLDTIMGKGDTEIENLHKYHGQALSDELADRAFKQLGQPSNLDELRVARAAADPHANHHIVADRDISLSVGEAVTGTGRLSVSPATLRGR
jgi:transketolase